MDHDYVLEGLIARIADGDDAALPELIAATMDDVRGFVACQARRAGVVEEVVHDTYVDAALSAARYETGRSVRAWLKGIARHRLLRRLRDDARRMRTYDPQSTDLGDLAAAVADPGEDLVRAEEDGLRTRALADCLQALNPQIRHALERFYQHGDSLAQLATSTSRTPLAVAKALSRVRVTLRACLERVGVHA